MRILGRINQLINSLSSNNIVGKTLSGVKKTLNKSSAIVDAVNNIGDSLQDNIEDEVGGITGAIGGWIAGKSIKVGGSIVGGVVAGTLKTVAGVIPTSSDIKLPESDAKIAHCVDTYAIPTNKEELLQLLQFTWQSINSKTTPYGKQTLESLRICHSKIYTAFTAVAKGDNNLLEFAKSFAPKKRWGMF